MIARVMLVQSDGARRRLLEQGLLVQGFSVTPIALAVEAFAACRRDRPDAVLIDLATPDMDGLSLLAALRQMEEYRGMAAIVMVPKGGVEAVLRAFELGADDCMEGAVDMRELGARLGAVLRRRAARDQFLEAPIRIGDVRLDPSRRLCRVGRKEISLRPLEFALLETLMRRAGRVLSRRYLLENVWGMPGEASTRTVDVAVSRLRRRLQSAGWMIETVLKAGYRLRRSLVSGA